MSAFAIRPPVYLSDGHVISSSPEAASVVKRYASLYGSLTASALFHRLEEIDSDFEAQSLSLEFCSWAAREGLLLAPPRDTAKDE